MKRKLVILFFLALILSGVWLLSAKQLKFSTSGISAEVDGSTSRLVSIENRITGVKYRINSDLGSIVIGDTKIDLSTIAVKLISSSKGSCTFAGQASGMEVTWTYIFPSDRSYFDRQLSIRNVSNQDIVVKNVKDCDLTFATPFQSIAFHDDNMTDMGEGAEVFSESKNPSLYRTSVNVFMRDEKGGLCSGLKYPYFNPEISKDHIALSYETNYRLKAGEVLDLPVMFCAAYKKTGYTCRKEFHWEPRIISTVQEEMDWGEVRTMQQVMADYLPEQKAQWNGYYIFLNAWWAKRGLQVKMGPSEAEAYCQLIDNVKQSKCLDMFSIAPVWLGWAEFIHPSTEIDNIGADAAFPMNDEIRKVTSCAKKQNIPVCGFCEPNSLNRHYRKDRPDWKVKPQADSARTITHNCHANSEYEDWFYRLTCSVIDSGKLYGWAWDHCWVRRPNLCYGDTHGHELGNCEFQQYRNVTGLVQKLRQRYPLLFMQVYWGLKEAGPWSLKGLNSHENAYENDSPAPPNMSAADDLRFQHWFNHNYRFIPTYMNMAQINLKKEKNGYLYSLLSCMSASTHASLCDWAEFNSDNEADEIFHLMRQWKVWASKNITYLKDRIDIFGQPCRKGGIDGTVHIIGDEGFIFVFNPHTDAHWGSIPLTDMIGLNKGSKFELFEISSGIPKPVGVYAKGDNFIFEIAPKSAMLLELKPTEKQLNKTAAPEGIKIQQAFSK